MYVELIRMLRDSVASGTGAGYYARAEILEAADAIEQLENQNDDLLRKFIVLLDFAKKVKRASLGTGSFTDFHRKFVIAVNDALVAVEAEGIAVFVMPPAPEAHTDSPPQERQGTVHEKR